MVLNRITLLTFLLYLFAACSGGGETEKFDEETGEETIADPKSLYVIHCVSCHGPDGKQGTSEAADLSVSTMSDKEVKQMILNGNEKGMMPYRDIITSDREVDSLVQYVKTLRK